jgi:hypothetical protein
VRTVAGGTVLDHPEPAAGPIFERLLVSDRLLTLWSGPGLDDTPNWQNSWPWNYGTISVWQGGSISCTDWGGFSWWDSTMYVEGQLPSSPGVWSQFLPYPGHSKANIECMDA